MDNFKKGEGVMNKKCFVAVLSMLIVLMGEMCFADIIYLKNGQRMEGVTKEAAKGVYVDGMLFTHDEIERIQVVPTAEKDDKDRNSFIHPEFSDRSAN